jgi:8-oxo-dGTP diphosphatase
VDPEAAVAIVDAGGAEESVLLIRRAERQDDPWSGHWSLPGGRREPGDRDLVETALRELAEECGIRLGRESLDAALPLMEARRPAPPYLLVAPFVFRVPRELPASVDVREAVEARWAPLSTLRDPARHCLQCVPGRPQAFRFPAVELDTTPQRGPVRAARVRGRIPDAAVLARFSAPGREIPAVNMLEARPDYVRIVGLAFEEYLIEADWNSVAAS